MFVGGDEAESGGGGHRPVGEARDVAAAVEAAGVTLVGESRIDIEGGFPDRRRGGAGDLPEQAGVEGRRTEVEGPVGGDRLVAEGDAQFELAWSAVDGRRAG